MSDLIVLHLIESISRGGATRAAIAIAKYARSSFPAQHFIAPLSLKVADDEALKIARADGLNPVVPSSEQKLLELIDHADIIHLHWWNSSIVDKFTRKSLPPHRLVTWCHVGGHAPPQIIAPELLEYSDKVVACSPYTYESPFFADLSPEDRVARTAMAYGATDFDRIGVIEPTPHDGFNIGYLGTVHFVKMHRNFISMSARANIPDAKFIVCGTGGAEKILKAEAEALGCADKFDFMGYAEDIRPVLANLDVYGYPLCPDNYSGSELNLQEAMYAGLPVVAFPYGGVSRLLIDGYTGIFVRSELEYAQALEFLYRNPTERARLGNNAREYAKQIFGAAPAAKVFVRLYQELLQMPKRAHRWIQKPHPLGITLTDEPSDRFIASLGRFAAPFIQSKFGGSLDEVLAGDAAVRDLSELMRSGGIVAWAVDNPEDPYLLFWQALGHLRLGNGFEALQLLTHASQKGFPHWRIAWYMACGAENCGQLELAARALQVIVDTEPMFPGAVQLFQKLADHVKRLASGVA